MRRIAASGVSRAPGRCSCWGIWTCCPLPNSKLRLYFLDHQLCQHGELQVGWAFFLDPEVRMNNCYENSNGMMAVMV